MKKQTRKLVLKKETLSGLERVIGGVQTDSCYTCGCGTLTYPTRTTDTDTWTDPK